MVNLIEKFWDSFTYYFLGVRNRIEQHNIFLLSSGVAFTMLVCVIPIFLIVLYVLRNIVEQSAIIYEINSMIDKFIPYPEYANTVKQEVLLRLASLSKINKTVGVIGVVGLLSVGSSLFNSVRTVLNKIFHASKSEKFHIAKLYDFILMMVVLLFFGSIMIVLPFLSTLLRFESIATWLHSNGFGLVDTFLLKFVSMILIFLVFYFVFWLIPISRTNKRIVFVSAITATIFWKIAEILFSIYIQKAVTLQYIYGVYSFIVIVAFWIYYSASSMFIAAEIGQLYYEKREKDKIENAKSLFFKDNLEKD